MQAEPALKCNFGSKLVEVRGYSLFCDEKRIPSITPKRKGRSFRSFILILFIIKLKLSLKSQKVFRFFFQTHVGLKTICPPTADGGAKAGFKVQRLSPG